MNWIEKVRYLKERLEKKDYDQEKYFIDVSYNASKWIPTELETILKLYPFVSKSYIEFAKEFDNLGLSFVTFYGSKAIKGLVLQEEITELTEYGFSKEYFPFAKDPAGSVFAIAEDGSILYFDIDDYEFANPQKLANSFEEFIDECVLGKRYTEFDSIENNTYYNFLKSLGWME
ncbi:MAG: SMI1/KNR4 family protein [Rickettsiaceae bacterium]|nr:SMI1/KNR4 family protein [Rickettsiaceae bacterium]